MDPDEDEDCLDKAGHIVEDVEKAAEDAVESVEGFIDWIYTGE